ncbi:MAG: hypothetical protein AB1649_06230 [Chloroflexota bacterium]
MMKRLTILPVIAALLACSLFVPKPPTTATATETETLFPMTPLPSPTFMMMCTPPACSADETYYCPGDCPGGCGTVCATVTPESGLSPITTVQGAGEWILKGPETLAFLDPSGEKPGFALQRVFAPLLDFILVKDGNVYALTDPGDGTLTVNRVYPSEYWVGELEAMRNVEGSLRTGPIFSADGSSLVWSRAESADSLTRALFVTSLDTGESREVWRTELPPEVEWHALVPLFYDEQRQVLVYALHTFYSGMSSTQVASLYLADLNTGEVTPLWPLKLDGMHAGVSAAVSADGSTLAYLTWGEFRDDFTLPWTLHLRDLSTGQEIEQPLLETWENAEVYFFSPAGNRLALAAGRHTADGGFQNDLLIFNLQEQSWNSIYNAGVDNNPFLLPRAWSSGDWLIVTNDDGSNWVMRPDGQSLTQITTLEWVGMLRP